MNEEKKEVDEYLFDNLNEYQAFIKNNKRTMLHTKSTVGWLKSRYPGKTKKHYLLFPEELIEDMKIRKIFKIFDKDGSQALDLDEMVEMFQKYNIEIDQNELQAIYDIVDKTKDNALNYLEFKECAISQDANSIFSKMITKVRNQEEEQKQADQRNIYLPQRFAEMVTYLSYRINRDDLEQYLKERSHRITEKYEKYLQLFNLNGLDSAGATAHEAQIKDQKKLDKASDLEQRIFERKESQSDSDNESLEADKSFKNQLKEEQNKRKQKAQFRLSAATNSLRKGSVLMPPSNSPSNRPSVVEAHLSPNAQHGNYFLSGQSNAAIQNTTNSAIENSIGSHRGTRMKSQTKSQQEKQQQVTSQQEDETMQAKFTKFEAQNLSKKAQVKGVTDAQELFEQVNKQYGNPDNFVKTFYSTRDKWRNTKSKAKLGKSDPSSPDSGVKPRFFGQANNNNDFESTYNTQKSSGNIYGTKQKFSNETFRHSNRVDSQGKEKEIQQTQYMQKTESRSNTGTGWHQSNFPTLQRPNTNVGVLSRESLRSQNPQNEQLKFNSTAYTLGRRPKTNHIQLSQLGVDKSSFKSISNIMNRTLQQLESKRSQRNLFLSILPPSQRLKESENKVKAMSQKLFAQNSENSAMDPKLMQSIYKPSQLQEYQEREKQLINEIKQDIMDKFLINNKLASTLYDDHNSIMPYGNSQQTGQSFKQNENSYQKQHKQREIEILSRMAESREKSPVTARKQEFSTTATSNLRGNSSNSNINFRIKHFQTSNTQSAQKE